MQAVPVFNLQAVGEQVDQLRVHRHAALSIESRLFIQRAK
jgi:hypothetical protein